MSNKLTSSPIGFLLENRVLPSVLSLTLLLAGISTVSAPLLIASGIVAYGWPFLNVYLLNLKHTPDVVEKKPAKRLNSFNPSALGAR